MNKLTFHCFNLILEDPSGDRSDTIHDRSNFIIEFDKIVRKHKPTLDTYILKDQNVYWSYHSAFLNSAYLEFKKTMRKLKPISDECTQKVITTDDRSFTDSILT